MLHELIWEWKWLLRQAHCFHYTGKVQLPLWGTCVFGHKADFFAAQQTREFTLGPLIWLVLFFLFISNHGCNLVARRDEICRLVLCTAE